MYVFVDIQIDVKHLVDTVRAHFDPVEPVSMVSTIQFSTSLHAAKEELVKTHSKVTAPQARPLSQGEILGCTSPKVPPVGKLLYVGDGRFHLESIMISNPELEAYQYDPYSKKLTRESYDHRAMIAVRREAVETARAAKKWGVILGTLGRQGSPRVLEHLEGLLKARGIPYIILLLSEIFPAKLAMFEDVEAWAQIACPRLSIDWGYAFARPLLNPYEAQQALEERTPLPDVYPMDFYSADGGKWSVSGGIKKERVRRQHTKVEVEKKE
jgi:2-(3-amino-3-carboxypropyl)histidine synthase